MEIVELKELPDGGANLTVNITEEESKFLIEYAINHILQEYVADKIKEEVKK